MVHQKVVSVDEMRGQLKSLEWAQERLAATEPLVEVPFEAGKAELRIDAWGDKDVPVTSYIEAYLQLPGGTEYQLTKQAALEIGAAVGIPRKIQLSTDPGVLVPLVNWRLQKVLDDKALKGLGRDDKVLGLTRGTVSPFSNLAILDVMVKGLEKKYGKGEILVDYKFAHDLEHTGLRLIVPGHQRVITGTTLRDHNGKVVQADDTWSAGLDLYNSLIGLQQLDISGQLFRWWCTNGCTDTLHSVGGLSRRGTTQADALDWAKGAVDEVLGGLEPMLDHIQELTAQPVTGNVRDTLEGLFSEYSIPSRDRHRVIEEMAEDSEMTAYSLMQAVTSAANADDIPDRDRRRLMRMGGGIAGTHSLRCNLGRVHRVVPEQPLEGPTPEEFYAEHGEALAAEAAAVLGGR